VDILRLVAGVERGSEHPLGTAVLRNAERKGVSIPDMSPFYGHPWSGVRARVEGREVLVGTRRLMAENGVSVMEFEQDLQNWKVWE